MSTIQSETQNTIDHLCALSPTIRDYIDGEFYRGDIENVYEFTPEYILPLCIPLLIKELQLLGIKFSISINDLLSEKDNIDACIALREFFDAELFHDAINNKPEIIKCCYTLFQSQDISRKDYALQIVELAESKSIGDPLQIKRILPISNYLISTHSFEEHITAILETCITRSPITDVSMIEFTEYAKSVIEIQLCPIVERILAIGKDNQFEISEQQKNDYINFWLDLDHINQFLWLSKLTPEQLETSEINSIVDTLQLEIYQRGIFGLAHHKNRIITIEDLHLILLHMTVVNFVQIHQKKYPRLQYLITQPIGSLNSLATLQAIATPEQRVWIDLKLKQLSIINKE